MLLQKAQQKQQKATYKKLGAFKELERMLNDAAIFKHPTCPHLAPRKFSDDIANGLIRCIVLYIVFLGAFATRISNLGTWSRRLNRYIPGTSRNGLPDILATYKGTSLFIEVKVRRDKMRPEQVRIRAEQKKSGRIFFVATNYTEFKKFFDQLEELLRL